MRAAAPATRERDVTFDRETLGWLVAGLVVLGSIAFLFADGLVFVARQWSDPEYSHGWLIPAVTLFVLWSRREAILAERGNGAWLGVLLVVLALTFFMLSQMALVLRGPFLALIPLLVGLGFAMLGRRAMRHALMPLLFLVFAFPLPGSLAVPLSTTLQLISSKLGAGILNLVGVSVFLDGNIIDLGVYQLQVAEACSGLRYLFPLASFGFLCAWLYKAPLWARGLVLLATVPITILTNSARIAMTGLFIEYGSIELAEGFMHLFEGWVIFLVALAILFLLMWAIARLTGEARGIVDLLDFDRLAGRAAPAGGAAVPPRRVPAPFVACAGLLLATVLASGPLTERQQSIPERPGLVTFPLVLGTWQGQPIPVTNQSVLRALGADDHLLADYRRAGAEAPVNLWVAYYDHQLGDAAIHSPKDCLPGGGWEYVSIETIPAPIGTADGRPFQINRGVIAKGLEQMVIYYWLDMRGRQLTNDTSLKIYNLWDSFARGRSDGALVRLLSPVAPGETTAAADARLRDFLSRAYPLLEPHVGA
jgi:exosortase D (VPLPA-CTERM-specific)